VLNTLREIIVFVMRLHVEQTIYRDLRKFAALHSSRESDNCIIFFSRFFQI
jgi:hypothetical protein